MNKRPFIEWAGVNKDRLQGIATLHSDPNLDVMVMLIFTGKHWCGYAESPKGVIPQQMERVHIESFTVPTPTFYGPSGPIVTWMQLNGDGKMDKPNPKFVDRYWIGFDLSSSGDITVGTAINYLSQFVDTLYSTPVRNPVFSA